MDNSLEISISELRKSVQISGQADCRQQITGVFDFRVGSNMFLGRKVFESLNRIGNKRRLFFSSLDFNDELYDGLKEDSVIEVIRDSAIFAQFSVERFRLEIEADFRSTTEGKIFGVARIIESDGGLVEFFKIESSEHGKTQIIAEKREIGLISELIHSRGECLLSLTCPNSRLVRSQDTVGTWQPIEI